MSVLQYPKGLKPSDLQVWNNEAFDHGDDQDLKRSWSPLKPKMMMKSSESFDSSKENQSPVIENNSVLAKSPRQIFKQICPNGVRENASVNPKPDSVQKSENRDEKRIDEEIEEVEMQISLLSSRLEALRMEKAEKRVKNVEKRARIVTAKFMEPKQFIKKADERKKIEESLSMIAKIKVQRRGMSMGPSEIVAGSRRGLSMGPAEIFSAVKSPGLGKQGIGMITPVQSIQNRRKSCLWKLQDINEENLSLSPKSRKTAMAKTLPSRQAVTTVASRKTVKKDDLVLSSVQPKKLFKDGEKSVAAYSKKPLRPGRVVASRYNQTTVSSSMRKRSLPENDKDESKRCEKKRSLSVGKSRVSQSDMKSEIRVKKRWEIPDEIVLHTGAEAEKSPTIALVPDMLPRIRVARCEKDSSPRDSGPAKRVAELVGKKTFFSNDEDLEPVVCQALSFVDEETEDK